MNQVREAPAHMQWHNKVQVKALAPRVSDLGFVGGCGLSKARPLWQRVHSDSLGRGEVQFVRR